MDLRVRGEERFNLDRIQVFASGNDDILLPVNEENEAVLVLPRHISGMEPAVLQDFRCRFRIIVILLHDTRALYAEFTDFTLLHGDIIFIHDLCLPVIPRNADGADFIRIAQAKMDAARTRGFGKAVIRIIIMVREIFHPVLDQAGRNRLGTDMHEPPLAQLIFIHFQAAVVQSRQNVLSPGHKQPDDGTLLLGNRAEDRFRRVSFEKHAPAARIEGAEPVHRGTGVVERRNAQEAVILGRFVVDLFHLRRLRKRLMLQQDRLRETRRTGGIVNRAVIRILDQYFRLNGRTVGSSPVVILRITRA